MVNKDEKASADVFKGGAIRKICQTSEWKEIEKIFSSKYNSALDTLIDKEDVEARATIKVIELIYNDITNGLRMADIAREQLKKKIGG